MKRLKRLLNKCIFRPSFFSYNLLLHFLSSRFFPNETKIRIINPKDDLIQKKRKIWLGYRELADKALEEYKKEKGDYYKYLKTLV